MPKDLFVIPKYLEDYAKAQDAASAKAGEWAGVTSGLRGACWIAHGVVSGPSNEAFGGGHSGRSSACGTIAAAAKSLAEKLRAAKEVYEGVDNQLAEDVNKQMLDK